MEVERKSTRARVGPSCNRRFIRFTDCWGECDETTTFGGGFVPGPGKFSPGRRQGQPKPEGAKSPPAACERGPLGCDGPGGFAQLRSRQARGQREHGDLGAREQT